MEKKQLTIYDIAKIANVSVATISRVINNTGQVSQTTRELVSRVIEENNFKPNTVAQSLSTKETKTLGFILPDITNPYFATVFLEAEKYALDRGYTVMLCNSLNDHEIESKNLQSLIKKQVDGIIFMGGRVTDPPNPDFIQEMNEVTTNTPVVIINGEMEQTDTYQVLSDEPKGLYDAVAYLYRLGHRDIRMIGGVIGNITTDVKLQGFQQAMQSFGLQVQEPLTIEGRWSVEDGVACMKKVLELKQRPTALIAINDLVAIGALTEAKAQNIDIPNHLSIIGYDDIYWSKIFVPHLTTVNHNYQNLAAKAVDTIIQLSEGIRTKRRQVVSTKLIVRDSCAQI